MSPAPAAHAARATELRAGGVVLTLAAALDQAETSGQPVTVDRPDGIRVRVRVSEHGERQLAAYTATGPASEAQAEAAATEAGFARWTTDRTKGALLLTELETAEEEEEPAAGPPNIQMGPAPRAPLGPFRPGRPYPDFGPVGVKTLYHGTTRGGHFYTVIRYDEQWAGWRCDALSICVTEADHKYFEHFEHWKENA